jgi:cellulose synthase/poly-beta-1,6-N-acetylglucosamine synthase-like glycosyltransferase
VLLTWLTAKSVFWSSAGLLAYTYAGYPAGIAALARLRGRPPRKGPYEPTVSVVMAAGNEERVIGRKLDNLLALDYPREKLQIIVVSDGSTDRTDAIVRGYEDRGVLLERVATRSGKPTAINRGVRRATGEVLLFCDARQRVDGAALRELTSCFADPEVGAVSGELYLGAERGPGLYWRYEKVIRQSEGLVDSVAGATGALFAVRRSLFEELPADCLLDDVFTPMQIMLRGYRVAFEPAARVFDEEADLKGEFARKARTLAGNFQVVRELPGLIDPRRNRIFLQFLSHKLLRLACPYALAGLLGSNLVLVVTGAPPWPLYVATLAGQLGLYGAAALEALTGRAGKVGRLGHTFVVLNLAAVAGLWRYLRGDLSWTAAAKPASPPPPAEPTQA